MTQSPTSQQMAHVQGRIGDPILHVEGMSASYGAIRALRDLTLDVHKGEIVTVLGPNGAGKTTLMRTIAGAHPSADGSLQFDGLSIKGKSPEHILRRGISLVPEGRRIFASLTVEQNLVLGASSRSRREEREGLEQVYTRFPVLRQRRKQTAGTMSGGEQQQIAIARALMARPALILYDEPSLGLAPIMVDHIFELIIELRDTGITTLLVEQNAHRAVRLADWVYVLSSGTLVTSGPATDFSDRDLGALFMGHTHEDGQ